MVIYHSSNSLLFKVCQIFKHLINKHKLNLDNKKPMFTNLQHKHELYVN